MKILAPADHLNEVRQLIEAGADELYGGFVPADWDETFAAVGSINKRTFASAQFSTLDEVSDAVSEAKGLGASFYLTLNNEFYSPGQLPRVLELAEQAAGIGVDGVLVADLGLILELNKLRLPLELHLSILSAVLNTRAALFFKDLGVSRVVVDRSLTAAEIRGMIAGAPGLEFESFLMYGKCPNVEGLCTFFHHDDPDHNWPCGRPCEYTPLPADSSGAKEAVAAQARWAATARGNACGLCGVYDLMKAGLTAAKIAGRGRKTEHKLAAVTALKNIRDLVNAGATRADAVKAARGAHDRLLNIPCSPYECYFPAEA